MQLAIAALAPFEAHLACPKCESAALSTEYGTKYYVPNHPDKVSELASSLYVMTIGPFGTYHVGPDYLVRACTNCKYAWAEHAAPESASD